MEPQPRKVRHNKHELVGVVGAKGEGNRSQADKQMAVNDAQWWSITVECPGAGADAH
jgi:hypothetical protein